MGKTAEILLRVEGGGDGKSEPPCGTSVAVDTRDFNPGRR